MKVFMKNRLLFGVFACTCSLFAHAAPLSLEAWMHQVWSAPRSLLEREHLSEQHALDQACERAGKQPEWHMTARLATHVDRGIQVDVRPDMSWHLSPSGHLSVQGVRGPAVEAQWDQVLYGLPGSQVAQAQEAYERQERQVARERLSEEQLLAALDLYGSWWEAHQHEKEAHAHWHAQQHQQNVLQKRVALGQEPPEALTRWADEDLQARQAWEEAVLQRQLIDERVHDLVPPGTTPWTPVCPEHLPLLWDTEQNVSWDLPSPHQRLQDLLNQVRRAQQRAAFQNHSGAWRGFVRARWSASQAPRHDLGMGLLWESPSSHAVLRRAPGQRLRWLHDEALRQQDQEQQDTERHLRVLQMQRRLLCEAWESAGVSHQQALHTQALTQTRFGLGHVTEAAWHEAERCAQQAQHHQQQLMIRIWQLWAQTHAFKHSLHSACAAWLGGEHLLQKP